MSVTFFLANHQECVKYDNPAYNPTEPEDPIYNPRYVEENIYPVLNMSNINAAMFLEYIDLDRESYTGGRIKHQDIDAFCKKLMLLQLDSIRNNVNPRLVSYMKHLEKICRYALALNDDVVWC